MANTDRLYGAEVCQPTRGAAPFNSRLRTWLALLVIALLSAGCVTLDDPEVSQEHNTETIAALLPGQIFEQRLQPRRPGLSQVTIYLSGGEQIASDQPGWLDVEVFTASQTAVPLSSQHFPLPQSAGSASQTILLPAQPGSNGETYLLRLSTREGKINVMGRSEDMYPEGGAFLDGSPLAADAAFRTAYNYDPSNLWQDAALVLPQIWLALPLAGLLILPGWSLLQISGLSRRFQLPEAASLSIGLSLAIIPVMFTWTSQFGLHFNRTTFLLLLVVTSGIGLLQYVRLRRLEPVSVSQPLAGASLFWSTLLLAAIFLASLVLRWVMARHLSAPPWVDSIHHGLITRLVMENGAFPGDYTPYMQIASTAYHPGFHTVLAAFLWLSRMDLAAGMLLFGQVLNALAAPAAYLLGVSLTRNRDAGLAAALVVGLISPMPAYFTSWGRYTHLAGLLILPSVMAVVCLLLDSLVTAPGERKLRLRLVWLVGLGCAGLFLTHYRVAAFFACLLAAHLAVWLAALVQVKLPRLESWTAGVKRLPQRLSGFLRKPDLLESDGLNTIKAGQTETPDALPGGDDIDAMLPPEEALPQKPWIVVEFSKLRQNLLPGFGWMALSAVLAPLFALPWLPSVLQDLLLPKLQSWQGSPVPAFSDFSWTFLNAGRGELVLALAWGGLAFGLLARRPAAFAMPLWAGLMFLLANLDVYGLPGSGFVNDLSVAITLHLPLAVLVGLLVAGLNQLARYWIPSRLYFIYSLVLLAAAGSAGYLGARELAPLLNPVTITYRQADQGALNWLAENTAPDEVVLINPFAWGYGMYAGQDGGFWGSAVSGRPTLPPPVISSLGANDAQIEDTALAVQQVLELASEPVELRDWMLQHQIHYLILGRRGGVFSPSRLLASGAFTARYAEGGAWVIEALAP